MTFFGEWCKDIFLSFYLAKAFVCMFTGSFMIQLHPKNLSLRDTITEEKEIGTWSREARWIMCAFISLKSELDVFSIDY